MSPEATGDSAFDRPNLRLIQGGMSNAPASPAAAPTVADHAPPHAPSPAEFDYKKAVEPEQIRAAAAEKQYKHEIKMQFLRSEESHRARITWIGAGMTVLLIVAVAVAYKFNPAVGEKVLTMVGPFIGGFVGGFTLKSVAAQRTLPAKDDTSTSPG